MASISSGTSADVDRPAPRSLMVTASGTTCCTSCAIRPRQRSDSPCAGPVFRLDLLVLLFELRDGLDQERNQRGCRQAGAALVDGDSFRDDLLYLLRNQAQAALRFSMRRAGLPP